MRCRLLGNLASSVGATDISPSLLPATLKGSSNGITTVAYVGTQAKTQYSTKKSACTSGNHTPTVKGGYTRKSFLTRFMGEAQRKRDAA